MGMAVTFVVLVPLSMVLPLIFITALIEALGDYLITIILWLLFAAVVLFFFMFSNPSFGDFVLAATVCLIGFPIIGCYLHRHREQRQLEWEQRQRSLKEQKKAEYWMLRQLLAEADYSFEYFEAIHPSR